LGVAGGMKKPPGASPGGLKIAKAFADQNGVLA
jgi:hypothetical protein